MADDLDALFGAFDGDVDVEKEKTVEKEETHVEEPENSAVSNGDSVQENGDIKPPQAPSYTSVMSKPTASHLQETTDTTEEPKIEEPKDEDKEIATGTSHDKSVRSYSAYPKNLPPGTVYEPVEPPKTPAKEYAFKLGSVPATGNLVYR